ncbi:MAG: hypothetical protein EAZ97_12195 [Bacteroidetes bacterium]|nr:MAG: hypothetical protein EAZ97_12195 [Bacteroidota bacterium]
MGLRIFVYIIFLFFKSDTSEDILLHIVRVNSEFLFANKIGAFIFLFLMDLLMQEEERLSSFVYVLFLFGSAYFVNEFTIPFTRIFGEALTTLIIFIFFVLINLFINIRLLLHMTFVMLKAIFDFFLEILINIIIVVLYLAIFWGLVSLYTKFR